MKETLSVNLSTSIQERLLFLKRFLKSPKQMGSITPSSKFLCQKMMRPIPWHKLESIAELGPGTGAITKHILESSQKHTKVFLFEKEARLRELLKVQYPDFRAHSDASKLQAVIQAEGIQQLDCILSGLPFFNFPQVIRDQLLAQIQLSLKPNGLFIAFQYSLQMKKQLSQNFIIEEINFVPFNFPPAFVFVCRKRE